VVLSDVRPEYADGVQASTALLQGGLAGRGFRLRLRLHGDGPLDHSATPFLPILAMTAAASGRDGVVEGTVDAAALDGAARAMAVQAGFNDMRPPALRASEVVDAGPASSGNDGADARGTGLFFSRGVDSMSTFLCDRGELTHLIAIDWVDPPFISDGLAQTMDGTQAAAGECGLPLLRVTTNVRQILEPVPGWLLSHGQVLAAFALLLGPQLAEVRVASTISAGDPTPASVHERSDALWSSSATAIVHRHPVDGTRIDKTALVASDDCALRWLKVCFTKAGDGNCGVCPKCLMTMTTLDLVGVGDRLGEVFDAPLSVDAVLACVGDVQRGALESQRALVAALGEGPMRAAWGAVLAATEETLCVDGSALQRRLVLRESVGE
jgi:hypothetical protein